MSDSINTGSDNHSMGRDTNDSSDEEYNFYKETDKGDSDEQRYDEFLDRFDEHEKMADSAPMLLEGEISMPLEQQQQRQVIETQETEDGKEGEAMKIGKEKKGRGPNKLFKVTEPMYLEYDANGQPCGKWRRKYSTYVGICMRKLSILNKWKEVPEGLKKTVWQDTVNLFHIKVDQDKRDVFDSHLAQRFRDFKTKLVSGWITLRRDRSKSDKRKREETNNNSNKPSTRMPYDIWTWITKDEWEAFVAKKTTPQAVEKRAKHSNNASKKELHHHMGRYTYGERRQEWISEGFYPGSASSMASTSAVSGVIIDRPSDYYCSLHGKDKSGKRTISDPGKKKVADALMGWKEKEAKGEFTPVAEKDALYQVLGKDHGGVVRGVGGIRVRKKKAFGAQYSATRATSSTNTSHDMEVMRASIQEDIEEKMNRKFTAILDHLGVKIDLDQFDAIIAENAGKKDALIDKVGEKDPLIDKEGEKEQPTTHEVLPKATTSRFDPLIHELKEETPCDILLPSGVDGHLVLVGYGRVRVPTEAQKVHFKTRDDSHFSVGVDTILDGFEDFKLPVPIEKADIYTIIQAQGTFVSWPCAWVQFSNKVLEKLKKEKTKELEVGSGQGKSNSKSKSIDAKSKSVDVEHKLSSKGSTSFVKAKGNLVVDKKLLESFSRPCFWLHCCVSFLPDNSPIEVELDMSQFHYLESDAKTWVQKDDISLFLCGEMLCVSILHVFMSALAENVRGCESVSKVGWLCPREICAEKCLQNPPEVKEYVKRAIIDCIRAGNKFILAPYLQQMHWLLLVILPLSHTIYVFDPARPTIPRQLLLKTILNSKMKEITGSGIRRNVVPTWKSMVCPKQQNDLDCGLYVMRFMHDLVSSCTEDTNITTVYGQSAEEPFTSAEINNVRDMFATYLTDNFL